MDKYQKYVRLLSNDMLINDMSHFVHPKDEEEEKYLLVFAEEIKRRLYPTNTNKICTDCVHHTKYGCDNLNPDLRLRVVCDGYKEWDGPDIDLEDPLEVDELDLPKSTEKLEAIIEVTKVSKYTSDLEFADGGEIESYEATSDLGNWLLGGDN